MKLSTPLALVILVILSATISYYIHSPWIQTPLIGLSYSDILHGVFYMRFNPGDPGLWFNIGKLEELRGGHRVCPIPYIDYKFEYPPIIALLFYISTCAGILTVFPQVYPSEDYGILLEKATIVHYNIQALTLTLSLAVTIALVYIISRSLSLSPSRSMIIPLLPSTLLYTVYNWDFLAVLFLIAGFYTYMKRRYEIAGLLVGFSVSTKLLTVLAGLILAVRLLARGDRDGFKLYTLSFTISVLAPHAFLYIISPQGFHYFINHHASWYCENCIYMLVERDIWSPLHKILAAFIIGFATALTLVASTRLDTRIQDILFVSTTAPIIFNYVFTPQMIIMITPAAFLALNTIALLAYMIADLANALIITAFFSDLSTAGNPWTLDGMTQKLAMLRNLILLTLWVYTTVKILGVQPWKRMYQSIRS